MSQVNGLREMQNALGLMEAKVSRRLVTHALKAGAKVVAASTVTFAPSVSGITRAAVKVTSGKRKRNRVQVFCSIAKKWFTGTSFYASFNELGHKAGRRAFRSAAKQRTLETLTGKARTLIPGKHWMQRAFKASAGAAAIAIENDLKAGLEKAAKSRGK